jgi:hypothetical protein
MKPLESSASISLGAHSHEIDEQDLHLLSEPSKNLCVSAMISLLDSRISIRDLLAFLSSKTSGAA